MTDATDILRSTEAPEIKFRRLEKAYLELMLMNEQLINYLKKSKSTIQRLKKRLAGLSKRFAAQMGMVRKSPRQSTACYVFFQSLGWSGTLTESAVSSKILLFC